MLHSKASFTLDDDISSTYNLLESDWMAANLKNFLKCTLLVLTIYGFPYYSLPQEALNNLTLFVMPPPGMTLFDWIRMQQHARTYMCIYSLRATSGSLFSSIWVFQWKLIKSQI